LIKVGDIVRIKDPRAFAGQQARVVEDRGNLGVGGRRLLGLRWLHSDEYFEMPEAMLAVVTKARRHAR
jgi:hypothetical protein